MKQITCLLPVFLILLSFNAVHAQRKKISFCDGMKLVQKTFQDGRVDELKDTVDRENKYSFSSKLDIDDVTDESVGTNLGTYYHANYRSTTSKVELDKALNELVSKLEQCFNKKAKESKINGYQLKVGKVLFSAMYLGSRAIILMIREDE